MHPIKTKLLLMKTSTIPRLELCGAVLLASWLSRMHRILEVHVKISGVYACLVSTIALSWLLYPHVAFKVFVSNCVHHIKTLLPVCKWAHVRFQENPVDYTSRGLNRPEIVKAQLY